jgi:two-component system KDP operon response regulator KdpE
VEGSGNVTAPLRVLVVDDEPLICWSIAETLEAEGDIVTEAHTGAAALRELAEAREPLDVVILDYNLPDVRNLNLLSTLRRLSPASRVILMSAHVRPEIVDEALDLGASRFLDKPFDMRILPALVHEVASREHTSMLSVANR